jgi:hypothetical protein
MTCRTSDGVSQSVADVLALHLGECRGAQNIERHVVGIEDQREKVSVSFLSNTEVSILADVIKSLIATMTTMLCVHFQDEHCIALIKDCNRHHTTMYMSTTPLKNQTYILMP